MSAKISTKEICAAVVQEIRAIGLVTDPRPPLVPPWDGDAEQDILSALLNGYATCAGLRPLHTYHFFATVNQIAFCAIESIELAGEPVTPESVERVMRAGGAAGPLGDELHTMQYATPFRFPSVLLEKAERIMELYRRRRLVERLDLVRRLLHTDGTTSARAAENLEAYFGELALEAHE